MSEGPAKNHRSNPNPPPSDHLKSEPTTIQPDQADVLINPPEMIPGMVVIADTTHQAKADTGKQRQMIFRSLRLCLGFGIVAGLGWMVWQQQRRLTSQQGFINGTIVSVPAPIAGQLQLTSLKPGSPIQLGQQLGQVANPRNPQLEIDRQQLQSKLAALQLKRQSLQSKQSDRYERLQQFQTDREQQGTLSVTVDNSRRDRLQVEIEQAQQAAAIAQREANRLDKLVKAGAIAQIQLDKTQDEVQSAQLRIAAKQTELAQAETEQIASQRGLQIDGAQSINYAETRSRELQDEIADLDREVSQVVAEIAQVNQEITTLDQQLNLQKFAQVEAPIAGVVWAMPNQIGNGKTVASNESLIQVLDCNQTWVDTFVSERELPHLKIGDAVTVTMLGDRAQKFTGRIQAIRAGVGRVAPGTDVAVPPPPQSQRQVGVQVGWENNPAITQQAAQFCGVGQSVEVAFQKSKSAQSNATLSFNWMR
jgi:multidrug resistance efflux pump